MSGLCRSPGTRTHSSRGGGAVGGEAVGGGVYGGVTYGGAVGGTRGTVGDSGCGVGRIRTVTMTTLFNGTRVPFAGF